MTAEVGVMNRLGIALAADSAVTIGPSAGKIYTSANKLFQLSKKEPIGIMVYANSDLLGVPWETIIKQYRNQLKDKPFPRLSDYAKDFIRFLKTEKRLFPAEDQKKLWDSRYGIDPDLNSQIRVWGFLPNQGTTKIHAILYAKRSNLINRQRKKEEHLLYFLRL